MSDFREKYTKRSSWHRIILNGTPKEKGPMNSVLPVSPFVSSIFFSESALKTFLMFCINLGDNMGQKRTLTKFFKYFGIFPKTTLRIFLIFCQNVELNSVFQPVKTVCEKKKLVQKLFQVKDALRLIIK